MNPVSKYAASKSGDSVRVFEDLNVHAPILACSKCCEKAFRDTILSSFIEMRGNLQIQREKIKKVRVRANMKSDTRDALFIKNIYGVDVLSRTFSFTKDNRCRRIEQVVACISPNPSFANSSA